MSVRFNQDLFDPTFINSDGSSEMNHGKPYPWRYYGLRNIKGIKVGTALFSDAENLNYPEPWFVTNTEDHPFYYFSPAPIFNQPHVLEKDEQLKLKYRMQFYTDEVCLAWAHQRENHRVGYVTMASRSENIESNLKAATEDALSQEKILAINGDGSDENPGINANHRLIWGQVFFWPEARVFGHDKDVLWNDTQVFETKADYNRFRNAVGDFYRVWKETTVDLPIKYQS